MESVNRLLIVWFAVSFVLANHEFAMVPLQPLHFTRGYLWTPLFLLGAPVLVQMFRWMPRWVGQFERIPARMGGFITGLGGALLVLLFVADNAAWFVWAARVPDGAYHSPQFLSPEEAEVMEWLQGMPEVKGVRQSLKSSGKVLFR